MLVELVVTVLICDDATFKEVYKKRLEAAFVCVCSLFKVTTCIKKHRGNLKYHNWLLETASVTSRVATLQL